MPTASPAYLTAHDVQKLIRVDRSTIYRMAESGRLPAVKVGRQWRFPTDEIKRWLKGEMPPTGLPDRCMQSVADLFADLYGVMVIVADIDGQPITEISNPCGYCSAVATEAAALARKPAEGGCSALFARKNRAVLDAVSRAMREGREVFIAGDAVDMDKAPERLLLADLEIEPWRPFPPIPGAPRELALYCVTGFRKAKAAEGKPPIAERGPAAEGAFANGLRLLGMAERPLVVPEHGGLLLSLDPVWEAERPVSSVLYAVVTVLDDRMRPIRGESAWYTLGGLHPPSEWPPGEAVRDPVACLLPPLPPGRYLVALGLSVCDGNRIKFVPAGGAAGRRYDYVLATAFTVPMGVRPAH